MFAATRMEIIVSSGEWIYSILQKLDEATDGSTFLVPTEMHLHAFYIAVESLATNKKITVLLKSHQGVYDQQKSTDSQAR